MRVLSQNELKRVSGAEHSIVRFNTAHTGVRVVPLDNGTVNVEMSVLGHTNVWNSGVAVTCQTFGLGSGLMSLAFSGGNGVAASLVATVRTQDHATNYRASS